MMGIMKIKNKVLSLTKKRSLNEKVADLQKDMDLYNEGLQKISGSISDEIEDIKREMRTVSENLRNINASIPEEINGIKRDMEIISENLRNINVHIPDEIAGIRKNIESISENLRNNNAELELNRGKIDILNVRMQGLKKNSKGIQKEAIKLKNNTVSVDTESNDQYAIIDYFDFENHFRGSQDIIKENQKQYLKYFSKAGIIVDVGCGRGEFLQLLKEAGYKGIGVDVYQEYVDYCQMNKLNVTQGDGIQFLSELEEKVEGIFVGQVVEHLSLEKLVELCNISYQKLKDGGCAIFETPNPTSLSIYTNAFYMDPSHVKPVHPLTLQYFLQNAGFDDTQILFTESSKVKINIPKIDVGKESQEFNDAMDKIGQMLFGSQDYAIIARKKIK